MSVSVSLCVVLLGWFQSCFASSDKGAKPSPPPEQKSPATMINWAGLEVVDYLRSGALFVAFVVLILSDKRGKANVRVRRVNNWVNAEVVCFFALGFVVFFFPTPYLQYFSKNKLSTWHQVELQNFGTLLFGTALTTAKIQASIESDAFVHSSWLLSRLLGSASVFFYSLHAHFHNNFFTDQHLTFAVFGSLLWFLSCLYQVYKADTVGAGGPSRTANNRGVNLYLLIDLMFMLPLGLVFLADTATAYTQMATSVPDAFCLYISKFNLIFVVMISVQSLGALYYDDDGVKKAILFGRLVMFVVGVPLIALHQWKNKIFTSTGNMFMIGSTVPHFIACLLGYLHDNDKIKAR